MFDELPRALLIPGPSDLAAWGGVFFATFVFLGLGRALSRGRAIPEVALLCGWGGVVIVLTIWGLLTTASMRIPGAVLASCAISGLVVPRWRLTRTDWLGLFRIGVLALPLLAVMASAQPSEPDTFLNLLPNAAYLYDHGFFPADGRPPAFSFIAGAPYNMQIAALIAGLVTPAFPPSAMIGLNIIWQIAAGLLFARLSAGIASDPKRAPSWGFSALGFLLAIGLNPGFVPRYDVTDYSEPSVMVTLACCGWLAACVAERVATERRAGSEAWHLALILAVLVNIKQESVALALGIVIGAGAVALIEPLPQRGRAFALLIAAASPAAILYLAWRTYVLTHFAVGELKPIPISQWQIEALPLIFWHMLGIVANKGVYFGTLAATFVIVAIAARRAKFTMATRAGVILAGVFVIYNAALVFAYIAVFPGTMGSDAHSYFRYNTHLSLLMVVTLVLFARELAERKAWQLTMRWARQLTLALVLVAVVSPIAFLSFLRFDLQPPQLRLRALAKEAATELHDGDRVALILPHDNGSVKAALETSLRTMAPRRHNLDFTVRSDDTPNTLSALRTLGYEKAILSCATPGSIQVPPGHAALLEDGAGTDWHPVAVWPYTRPRPPLHWQHVLTDVTLCL